jgi:RNA polymerase sigma factor (sigma-70 family)
MNVEPSIEARDAEEFDRLLRFMTRPGPRFGLALATYADERVARERQELACARTSEQGVRTTTVVVDPSQRIANRLVEEAEGFDVLFVTGLDGIAYDVSEQSPLTRAVVALNFQRDTLPELLDIRVVFWVSTDAYAQLVRLAPDLLDVMLTRFEFMTEQEAPPEPPPPPPERPRWMSVSPDVDVSVLERQAESFAATAREAVDELTKADAAASAGQLFASSGRLEDAARWLDEAAASYQRLGERLGDLQQTLAAAAIQLRRGAEVARLRGDLATARSLAERSVELAETMTSPEQLRSLAVLASLPSTHSSGIDDWQLLERWRSGDSEAGSQLVARYLNWLRVYFLRRMPEVDIDDLIQETFLKLTRSLPPANRKNFSLRTFIIGIARVVMLERLRKTHHEPPLDEIPQQIASSENLFAAQAQRELLLTALDRISLDDRDLLELAFLQGFDVSELGELFGISPGTVRSRLSRARKRLRQAFEELIHDSAETPTGEAPDQPTLARWLEELRMSSVRRT